MTAEQQVIVLSIVASELVSHHSSTALMALICDNPLMKVLTMKAVCWRTADVECWIAGNGVRVSRETRRQNAEYWILTGRG